MASLSLCNPNKTGRGWRFGFPFGYFPQVAEIIDVGTTGVTQREKEDSRGLRKTLLVYAKKNPQTTNVITPYNIVTISLDLFSGQASVFPLISKLRLIVSCPVLLVVERL